MNSQLGSTKKGVDAFDTFAKENAKRVSVLNQVPEQNDLGYEVI